MNEENHFSSVPVPIPSGRPAAGPDGYQCQKHQPDTRAMVHLIIPSHTGLSPVAFVWWFWPHTALVYHTCLYLLFFASVSSQWGFSDHFPPQSFSGCWFWVTFFFVSSVSLCFLCSAHSHTSPAYLLMTELFYSLTTPSHPSPEDKWFRFCFLKDTKIPVYWYSAVTVDQAGPGITSFH